VDSTRHGLVTSLSLLGGSWKRRLCCVPETHFTADSSPILLMEDWITNPVLTVASRRRVVVSLPYTRNHGLAYAGVCCKLLGDLSTCFFLHLHNGDFLLQASICLNIPVQPGPLDESISNTHRYSISCPSTRGGRVTNGYAAYPAWEQAMNSVMAPRKTRANMLAWAV